LQRCARDAGLTVAPKQRVDPDARVEPADKTEVGAAAAISGE
jgi:hypothetical protein